LAPRKNHATNEQKRSIMRIMTRIPSPYLDEFLKPLSLYGAKVYEERWLLTYADAP
jgi:hypothetical protein